MSFRKILLAAAAAAALALPVAAPAAAQGTHAHRACTWSTSTSFHYGPPGSASITISNESPGGCEQFRVNITSAALDCGGGTTHCRYTSGWIKSNTTSSVTTCSPQGTCPGADGGALNTAYEDRRPTGTSSWQCRNLIAGGSWRNCSAN